LQDPQKNINYSQLDIESPVPETATVPPKVRPWGPWATLGLGAVIFIVYSVVQGIVYLFVAIATFGSWQNFDMMRFIESLNTNGLGISISTIVAAPIGVVLVIVFARLRRGLTWPEYLGLRPLSWKTVPVLIIIPVILAVLLGIIGDKSGGSGETDIMLNAYKNSVWPALFWIAIVICAPIFEEFLFRGFGFVGLQKSRLGSAGATVLTALIWALLHIQYNWFGMAIILVIGIVLGIVRTKTRSLWAPIVIHSIWNLLQMVAMVLVINGIIQQ
jgi:uncharacterized protein